MPVRAIFLVGFMAAGKTTVGKELARRLAWKFVDLDAQIESHEGKTVSTIFRDQGESGFRQLETNALQELISSMPANTVVALGGGAFIQPENRELLRDHATVFLEAPTDELWRRSQIDGIERPLRANSEQFALLYAERLPIYRQAKITIVTSGKDANSLCAEIERNLQIWGGGEAPNTRPQP